MDPFSAIGKYRADLCYGLAVLLCHHVLCVFVHHVLRQGNRSPINSGSTHSGVFLYRGLSGQIPRKTWQRCCRLLWKTSGKVLKYEKK